jgi:hypothetical protein
LNGPLKHVSDFPIQTFACYSGTILVFKKPKSKLD